MGHVDFLREQAKNNAPASGKIWLTMLIEYDIEGNAKIIRSFVKPAAESKIKNLIKPKQEKKEEEKIEINTENTDKSENLF